MDHAFYHLTNRRELCFICAQPGHQSNACPQKRTINGVSSSEPPGISSHSIGLGEGAVCVPVDAGRYLFHLPHQRVARFSKSPPSAASSTSVSRATTLASSIAPVSWIVISSPGHCPSRNFRRQARKG
ncbi:hypothetical protein OG21DRAFT_1164527 [Imleria badia]|nr:hypothetical protein OG21DRAFT_1164527 [Imleria badia]